MVMPLLGFVSIGAVIMEDETKCDINRSLWKPMCSGILGGGGGAKRCVLPRNVAGVW